MRWSLKSDSASGAILPSRPSRGEGRAVWIICLLFLGCLAALLSPRPVAAQDEEALPLAGKKAVLVIAPKGFRDEELFEPKRLLEARGVLVTIASVTTEEALGMKGGRVVPDVLLADVRAAEYDAIVFIGGGGAKLYFDDATAHALAREAVKEEKILAAICVAPVILARAGLLEGKPATVYKGAKAEIEKGKARYVEELVVREGRLVTACGPEAAVAFGEALIAMLGEAKAK